MNMNKIPDKIYVSRNFSEDDSPHGLWYLKKSEHDIGLEYIRKDALLEFLASLTKDSAKNAGTNDLAYAAHEMVCTLIDKIESL